MSKNRVPAIEGWFTVDGDSATLLGTKCPDGDTYFFPPEAVCRVPGHHHEALTSVPLSTTGTLWSYTNAGYQPPDPYMPVTDPYEPFCIAAVELDREKMVVLGQVVAGVAVDQLAVGTQMELVADDLYADDDTEYVVWKWRPVSSEGGAS